MILFIQILSVLVIWLSFWSLIPRDEWWIRGADFPRLQILIIGFIALGLYIFWEHSWTLIDQIIFVGLLAAQALQQANQATDIQRILETCERAERAQRKQA